MIGSIAIGVAVAFFMSLLNPVFYNRRSLEHMTKLPVLGVVSLSRQPGERVSSTIKHVKFTVLAALLPITCVALLYVLLNNVPLYENLKFNADGDDRVIAMKNSN